MRTFLVSFCSFTVIAVITLLAFNSDKGQAKQKDGIAELSQNANDSLVKRGEALVEQLHYSDQDLQAIAAYLDHK